jgi:pSer/pThr/pTyr-binding forkhead associated (FHA) protein
MPDGPVVAIIVLAVGGLLLAAYFVVEYQRHRRSGHKTHTRTSERLPLFGTDLLATRGSDGALHVDERDGNGADGAPRRRPTRRITPAAEFPTVAPVAPGAPSSAHATAPFGHEAFAPARANGRSAHEPARAAAYGRPGPAGGVAPAAAPDAAFANGETLRFALPDEGTLRFLPGRLEVVAGPDAGREIRFVAPPGVGDTVEITFGRTEGPAYRHVQLLARTVSRRHAVMVLSDDHWSLQNLSATNPVLLNGRALAADEIAPLLVDGDRIEMGEVVFTFHSR